MARGVSLSMILLDTCALLALASPSFPFSDDARALLEQTSVDLLVSAITAFEIGQKHAGKKIQLPLLPVQWYRALLDRFQIREVDVSASTAFLASSLPAIHRDPFDRILIATALERNLTILTCDRVIPTYPGIQTLW